MLKWLVFVTIIVWGVALSLPSPHQASSHPVQAAAVESTYSAWDACYEAQKYIKNGLKNPKTAEFPNCYARDDSAHTDQVSAGKYAVYTYVDAENSFGGRDRAYFMCASASSVQCIETDADHKTTLRIF